MNYMPPCYVLNIEQDELSELIADWITARLLTRCKGHWSFSFMSIPHLIWLSYKFLMLHKTIQMSSFYQL